MKVLKFGGKSLADKTKIFGICNYVKGLTLTHKLIVVVSAIGNNTDNLLNIAKEYSAGIDNLRELDVLLSTGETQSASLFSMALNSLNVRAISLQAWQIELKTMGKHGQSVVTGINKNRILSELKTHDVVVITGFQGLNNNNDITTLGRGGSDTTAVALGAVFNCEVEIFSDYDGVFTGDPKDLLFKKIKQIDYNSMQRIANNGAKVLSSTSVDIARQANVDVWCKQSSAPNKSGTHICNVPLPSIALTCKDNLCEINLLCNSETNNLQKTAKYIINNVNYYKIFIKNNKITLLLNSQLKTQTLTQIAKINNLLEVDNV